MIKMSLCNNLKKLKMKKAIFMVLAATLVAGCTKMNENLPETDKDGIAIQVKSTNETVKGEATRAPFFGNISGTNHLEARVVTYDKDGGLYANGTMIFTATNTATVYEPLPTGGGTSTKFPPSDDDYNLIGFYPSSVTDWEISETLNTGAKADFTFTGSEDIMVAAIETTTPNKTANGNYPLLTFKHQLTKLEIKVKAKDDNAAKLWLNVQKIELTKVADENIRNEFSYELTTGKASFSGDETTFPFYVIDNSQAVSANPVYTTTPFVGKVVAIEQNTGSNIVPIAYSMIAPFVSTGVAKDLTFNLSVKTADEDGNGTLGDEALVEKTVNISIPVLEPTAPAGTPITNTTGYAYSITFTFADTGSITATAEVIEWKDGGEVEQVIL